MQPWAFKEPAFQTVRVDLARSLCLCLRRDCLPAAVKGTVWGYPTQAEAAGETPKQNWGDHMTILKGPLLQSQRHVPPAKKKPKPESSQKYTCEAELSQGPARQESTTILSTFTPLRGSAPQAQTPPPLLRGSTPPSWPRSHPRLSGCHA